MKFIGQLRSYFRKGINNHNPDIYAPLETLFLWLKTISKLSRFGIWKSTAQNIYAGNFFAGGVMREQEMFRDTSQELCVRRQQTHHTQLKTQKRRDRNDAQWMKKL